MKLGKLFKSVVNVATLPISLAKDVITLGGVTSGRPQSFTAEKIEEIEADLDEVTE